MALNIPDSPYPRIVIIGAGFAGLQLARKLYKRKFQVVLLDKQNFHQFQPLFYQVAMAGLEPSSISFPLRKVFQKRLNVFIRPVTVQCIYPDRNRLLTDEGEIYYDQLVVATGAQTNYFNMSEVEEKSFSLKTVSEALYLRNHIFSDFEKALTKSDYDERQKYIDIAVVGGGPTGVEIAGALAEMRNVILPKDYTELNKDEMDIYLIQGGDRLLPTMSEESGKKAEKFLKELGVTLVLNAQVTGYDGRFVKTAQGKTFEAGKLIWCAGVRATFPEGLGTDCVDARSGRLIVDRLCRVEGYQNVFALGDVAKMATEKYPHGHPQVAQTAIQQAKFLAKYFRKGSEEGGTMRFEYVDKGSMATIGRNKAVVDLPRGQFSGFFAWVVWLLVHLFALIGTRNKVVVLLNWLWNYLTYDQSLRLIIKPHMKEK
jgi:NADH dehydrogenase